MNRLLKYFRKFQNSFKKISNTQKIIVIGTIFVVAIALVITLKTSGKPVVSYLFKRALTSEELGIITAELERMNYWYDTKGDKFILVKDEEIGRKIRIKLAQENKLPTGIKGWEIFDMKSWTTTEFDRNVKLHRAIEGEMRRHLEALEWIEMAKVSISYPNKPTLYTDREKAVGAAVSILPAEGFHSSLKKKNYIKGIENIIVKTIDGISRENITITDPNGEQINNFSDEDYEHTIKRAIEEEKIISKKRKQIEEKVKQHLSGILSEDRYKVSVDIELNFDRKSYDQKEILPIVVKSRTPGLPYDDSVIKENIKVSSKKSEENFKGQGFIPEGPPGQEPNIPPGYKENVDKWNVYNKNENIENFLNGEKNTKHKNDAYDIVRKSVAVTVDGTWKKEIDEKGKFIFENDHFKRLYTPYPENDLKKLINLVQAAINYNTKRGDAVVVRTVSFDRTKQFILEDKNYIKAKNLRRTIIFGFIVLILLFIGSIFYRFIMNELAERRRIKEREAARLRQLQREEALRSLENQATGQEYQLSEEDRQRVELQDRVEKIASERPEDVAKVIKTWLVGD